jgi:hypothetical protein
LLVAVTPSPLAVTVSVELATAVEALAANVSVVLADPEAALSGFADQVAVTPVGSPLKLKLTLPVNEPPVPTVKLTGALVPWAIVTAADPAVSVIVGAALTVSA